MNTGIFDLRLNKVRALCVPVAFLCLSACSPTGEGFSFAPKSNASSKANGPVVAHSRQASLAGGSIKVSPPRGYCTDDTSIRKGLQGGAVMIASCDALSGKSAGDAAAVISVNVSAKRASTAPAPSADDLAAAVAPLKVLAKTQNGALSLVHVANGGERVLKTADPKHWRAATALDSRLVLFSLYAPQGSALASDAGARLLTAVARGVSATKGGFLGLNADKKSRRAPETTQAEVAQPATSTLDTIAETTDRPKKGFSRLIGGLFNRS